MLRQPHTSKSRTHAPSAPLRLKAKGTSVEDETFVASDDASTNADEADAQVTTETTKAVDEPRCVDSADEATEMPKHIKSRSTTATS